MTKRKPIEAWAVVLGPDDVLTFSTRPNAEAWASVGGKLVHLVEATEPKPDQSGDEVRRLRKALRVLLEEATSRHADVPISCYRGLIRATLKPRRTTKPKGTR